ncbi:uncharacterized protein LOC117075477 isoform X1 [Trachypithecus francoisi]|uniref:uncharacterized protein LOC117075477 isoform X1 n=1 Tax=Trachypithecus francoisi TaxID=54180 RepID=UPI00141B6907|nr:uncharacterized protein LOC117075477 isoform X1 [Trachypithecus francoisi]
MDQDPNNCFLPIHSSRISWGPWELLPALTPRRRLKAPGLGDPHHPRRASGNSSGSGIQEITRVIFSQMLLHPYTQLPTSDPNYAP